MKKSCLVLLLTLLPLPLAAADLPERLRVATWNIEWFFDHETGDNHSDLAKQLSAPSKAEWRWRVNGVARAVAKLDVDILALQEIENGRVLGQLQQRLRDKHDMYYNVAFVQGRDTYTEQDVALLWRNGLRRVGRFERWGDQFDGRRFQTVPKHLFAEFQWGEGDAAERLLLVNVHLRAMPKGSADRQRQARTLKAWLEDALRRGENVMLLGDVNTEIKRGKATAEDEMGILLGLDTPAEHDRLVDLHERIDEDDPYTHLIFRQFDRILVSPSLIEDDPARADLVFKQAAVRRDACVVGEKQDEDHWNIYYEIDQAERDLSDHYPVVAEFAFDVKGDDAK